MAGKHPYADLNTIKMNPKSVPSWRPNGVTRSLHLRLKIAHRLASTDPPTITVVYGDLSVKNVAAEDLPLPVGP